MSGAVKRVFRPYIRRNTSPNENFEYGYPHSNAFLQFPLKLKCCKPICDVINDVKLFLTVYRRTLSQTGSTLARTNLSPFARCILRLNRHFY